MRFLYCCIGLSLVAGITGYGQVVVRPWWAKDTVIGSGVLQTAAKGTLNRFYRLSPSGLAGGLRQALIAVVDSAAFYGLERGDYLPEVLQEADSMVNAGSLHAQWRDWDRWYTEAALAIARDLYEGAGMDKRLSYDGVSGSYAEQDAQFLVEGLARVHSGSDLREWMSGLLPRDTVYRVMRDSLALYLGMVRDSIAVINDSVRGAAGLSTAGAWALAPVSRLCQLSQAMNTRRWVNHFHFDRMVVVNIASAQLRYYHRDSLVLSMKVVAGQPSKRTPRFAAWCNGVVLYPYWNVPHKIAVSELLPVFKLAPLMVASTGMQVVDSKGRPVDPSKISWASYTAANFPYQIRQTPGCFNALGVIKFNINSPFDVYLHDTNVKKAFASAYRYYSHGCIRLERPLDLGQALLDGHLDTTFLQSCFKDQRPVPLTLDKAVPVLVLYNTVSVSPLGKLIWYKDVYHLDD
jgi:hypothetical protein